MPSVIALTRRLSFGHRPFDRPRPNRAHTEAAHPWCAPCSAAFEVARRSGSKAQPTSTTVEHSAEEAPVRPKTLRPVPDGPGTTRDDDLTISLPVQPRQPRLAWHGWDRREATVSVPTQVVELVSPGRAVARSGQLPHMDVRQASARPKGSNRQAQAERVPDLPENRLIWTNDNVVALQTLLDERHPKTREYRYRGKVDLVYIDPPFMVQNDFRAENSIDVDLDDDEDIDAKKEPSLVEILAYKDTWRQGLDSFLSMLRARLVLLKELLATTGSIYVHLDWHTVHYAKVLMDEIFGYENLVNELVWQRTTGKSLSSRRAPSNHDVLLSYGNRDKRFWNDDAAFVPYDLNNPDAKTAAKYCHRDEDGRVYRLDNLINPNPNRPNLTYEFLGVTRVWRWCKDRMVAAHRDGLVIQTRPGSVPQLKRYLDEQRGRSIGDVWSDINPINSQAIEDLGYPTQKPLKLIERIVSLASPPGGLVLDCFAGSGTTAEASERLGRRWISVDNSKYAIHLTRKRLIQLNGSAAPTAYASPSKEDDGPNVVGTSDARASEPRKRVEVAPFTVENMGVYQRAETWQGFQTERTRYRDEMLKVFGAVVVQHSALLHGTKGGSWVHVGPLDAAVSSAQVWSIAREAKRTERKSVTILSADFDTLSGSDKDDIKEQTGVTVIVRIIPASAIDEVRRRLELQRVDQDDAAESMAVPAFYAPLAITINASRPSKRLVKLTLVRCEIDIESFLESQRPMLKHVTDKMSPAAKKRAKAERDKWEARRKDLDKWLHKATTWQRFIDFWAVDWDYGARIGADEKPIFETAWQSFRSRCSRQDEQALAFEAECQYPDAGHYRIAAKVTDVFGNDGLATVNVQVK